MWRMLEGALWGVGSVAFAVLTDGSGCGCLWW